MRLKYSDYEGTCDTEFGTIAYRYFPGRGVPLVFLSGLSDSMNSWNQVHQYLDIDQPRLYVDLLGQGHSVVKDKGVHYSNQVACLKLVLDHLKIKSMNLIGFSYGGGVAMAFSIQHPKFINQLVLMVPFIIRLDQAFGMQRIWRNQFNLMKAMPGPWQMALEIADRQYEKFIDNYMNYRFALRVPKDNERRKIIELSRGIFDFDGFSAIKNFDGTKIHFLTVDRDTLVPKSLYREFWNAMNKDQKSEWVHVSDGEHLLLEQAPVFVANYLKWVFGYETPKSFEIERDYHGSHIYEDVPVYAAEAAIQRVRRRARAI